VTKSRTSNRSRKKLTTDNRRTRNTLNASTQHNADFSLDRNVWGQLVLVLPDGRRVEGVEVVRAFPISEPGEYVSICDAESHELICIEDPSSLPPAVLELLEEELQRREFVPVVLRIDSVSADTDPSQWRIVTNRGPTSFFMEDSDHDVRRLGPNRILLVDTHGIRYLIPDTQRLDSGSRRILDRYL
jgi:hypothetical protein